MPTPARRSPGSFILSTALVAALACQRGPDPADSSTEGSSAGTTGADTTAAPTTGVATTGSTGEPGTTGEPPAPETARVVHSFGVYPLAPQQETEPCVQWTLGNEEALYVNAVILANDGGYHHSNWFAVPESIYPGDDGYWKCSERGYNEITSAVEGTVLFAQSTQSRFETMQLPAGAVIKIPPRHKLVAGVHFLNLSTAELESEMRMALDIIHPRDVDVVLAPMHLDYRDLAIPAQARSRFTGNCSFAATYEDAIKHPLDMQMYYVLPHYHYLGEFFQLEVLGGPRDGEVVFTLDGFNGGANGKAFDPPLDLTGADGLRFACGYDNWLDKPIGYGIGDQEMCAMLGLVDARVMIESRISEGSAPVGVDGDVLLHEADCANFAVYKNAAQRPPTQAERDAPLYVPPVAPGDVDLEPGKPCVDSDPGAAPHEPATLTSVYGAIFQSSCTFSSCHDAKSPAAGLDLQTYAGLGARLLAHDVAADTDAPLVAPGDPSGSWLYQVVSRCQPTDASGQVVTHMPFNAPTLLPDPLVAKLRAWITAGAPTG